MMEVLNTATEEELHFKTSMELTNRFKYLKKYLNENWRWNKEEDEGAVENLITMEMNKVKNEIRRRRKF